MFSNHSELDKLEEILNNLNFKDVHSVINTIKKRDDDTKFLIVLNSVPAGWIPPNILYTSNNSYIVDGKLKEQYPQLIWDGYKSVSETINIFKKLIVYRPIYDPKKFIYEGVKKLKDF